MRRNGRQAALLAVLALVLAGAVAYQFGASPSAPVGGEAGAVRSGAPAREIPVTGLRLDLLAARERPEAEVVRDPFRFRPRPAPARSAPAVVERAVATPPPPAGPPPPPPIPLKFIGVLDAPARLGRLAILSDGRGGVFYGKEGDVIEGRYRVLRVSNETADLAYVDGRGRQTIRLTGQ